MRLTNYWSDEGDNPLFNLGRNQRKPLLRDIIIEAMRKLAHKPLTKPELQKLVRIRRKTFLKYLAMLVEVGAINRLGTGTRNDPYRYVLAEHYRVGQQSTD